MPAYQAPYWNFQAQPPPCPPPGLVPPHSSADPQPSGSRNQPPLMPPPPKTAKRSVEMDMTRDRAVALCKDLLSESEGSFDNLANLMIFVDQDLDTTVYPAHYEELFKSIAEPPATKEATPLLPPRANLHLLIRSALDQAAAVILFHLLRRLPLVVL